MNDKDFLLLALIAFSMVMGVLIGSKGMIHTTDIMPSDLVGVEKYCPDSEVRNILVHNTPAGDVKHTSVVIEVDCLSGSHAKYEVSRADK
jgi:hypothetical protein